MLPVFPWSCEPPANAGDGLADELPQRLEQVEDAQYAERVKASHAAALPAARTNEIHGERDDRKRRHADVEEPPGPVCGFVLVEVETAYRAGRLLNVGVAALAIVALPVYFVRTC